MHLCLLLFPASFFVYRPRSSTPLRSFVQFSSFIIPFSFPFLPYSVRSGLPLHILLFIFPSLFRPFIPPVVPNFVRASLSPSVPSPVRSLLQPIHSVQPSRSLSVSHLRLLSLHPFVYSSIKYRERETVRDIRESERYRQKEREGSERDIQTVTERGRKKEREERRELYVHINIERLRL